MVINKLEPSLFTFQTAAPERSLPTQSSFGIEPQRTLPGQGVIVDISPEGRAAYEQNKNSLEEGISQTGALAGPKECQTCKSRKYQDVSNDSSVSFQTPTHISPGQAASSVASHEREHVAHEQQKAEQEDRRIVSQTVSLETSICPECGRVYVSGGVTRTLTASDNKGDTEQPSSKPKEKP